MRHIRVFAQPIGRFHDVAALAVTYHSRRLPKLGFLVLHLFRIQLVPVLVVGLPLIVHEEIDAGGKEVHGGCLEELVAAATSLFLAFLQGFQQRFRRFAGCGKVWDILRLYRVHPPAVLYIHKVDDIELATFWQFP